LPLLYQAFNSTPSEFIALTEDGKDVFAHINTVWRSGLEGLAEGKTVDVTYRQGAKGLKAQRVESI
jgi:cold shock CspA family protein